MAPTTAQQKLNTMCRIRDERQWAWVSLDGAHLGSDTPVDIRDASAEELLEWTDEDLDVGMRRRRRTPPDAVLVDATSADVVVRVAEALSETNRAALLAMPVSRMVEVAIKVVARAQARALAAQG